MPLLFSLHSPAFDRTCSTSRMFNARTTRCMRAPPCAQRSSWIRPLKCSPGFRTGESVYNENAIASRGTKRSAHETDTENEAQPLSTRVVVKFVFENKTAKTIGSYMEQFPAFHRCETKNAKFVAMRSPGIRVTSSLPSNKYQRNISAPVSRRYSRVVHEEHRRAE